ncbi:MAG: alpha/beta fold hydrolase, partial [Thalassobaculaceae bacterium]
MAKQTATKTDFRRDGPRPLGLHLATAAATWMSSATASASLRTAWPHWNATANGDLTAQFNALRDALADQTPPTAGFDPFAVAVVEASLKRMNHLLGGILAYRRHPHRRQLPPAAEVWRDGPARLLDYAPDATGPTLLVVPSLINRAYIVDLQAERSFVRWLAARGFRPLVLDWGAPDATSRAFTLTDVIAGRLESALTRARTLAGRPVTLVGYCMGGTLAVALAQRRPDAVAALVCMAAPWDFTADAPAAAGLLTLARPALETVTVKVTTSPRAGAELETRLITGRSAVSGATDAL